METYVSEEPWSNAVGYPAQPGQNGWSMFETHYNDHVQTPYQQECPAEQTLRRAASRSERFDVDLHTELRRILRQPLSSAGAVLLTQR